MSQNVWLEISDNHHEVLINLSNITTIKKFHDIQLELYCIHITTANGKKEMSYSSKESRDVCYERLVRALEPTYSIDSWGER